MLLSFSQPKTQSHATLRQAIEWIADSRLPISVIDEEKYREPIVHYQEYFSPKLILKYNDSIDISPSISAAKQLVLFELSRGRLKAQGYYGKNERISADDDSGIYTKCRCTEQESNLSDVPVTFWREGVVNWDKNKVHLITSLMEQVYTSDDDDDDDDDDDRSYAEYHSITIKTDDLLKFSPQVSESDNDTQLDTIKIRKTREKKLYPDTSLIVDLAKKYWAKNGTHPPKKYLSSDIITLSKGLEKGDNIDWLSEGEITNLKFKKIPSTATIQRILAPYYKDHDS